MNSKNKNRKIICNWKGYGLFGNLDKGIYVFVKEKLKGENIFMPILLEGENNVNKNNK